MNDFVLVLVVGAITFASRILLLVRPSPEWDGRVARFLELFPLALFTAIATAALVAPEGSPALTPGLAAAAGGLIGAALFKRSLLGILVVGGLAFYAARVLVA